MEDERAGVSVRFRFVQLVLTPLQLAGEGPFASHSAAGSLALLGGILRQRRTWTGATGLCYQFARTPRVNPGGPRTRTLDDTP